MREVKIASWQPHGEALLSYFNGNKSAKIDILMDDGSVTKMPVEIYFRKFEELPELEKQALKLCRGKILDVGAGAGAHSIILQQNNLDVTALDICKEGVEVIKCLGVEKVIEKDFLSYLPKEKYDTLLFLMNGIGIAGNLESLEKYLNHAFLLTTESGQLILDSSDLRNGEVELNYSQEYFGVFKYQLRFNGKVGEKYEWLYVDFETLNNISQKCGWKSEIIYEQEDGSYLARLTKQL